jgi:hypothetical protein
MTVRGLAIDAVTGDVALDGARLRLVSDAEAVLQAVRSNLRLILGEWFVNTAKGLDHAPFGVKPFDLNAIRQNIQEIILGTVGVASLETLDLVLDKSTRVLTVTFQATTDTAELITDTLEV